MTTVYRLSLTTATLLSCVLATTVSAQETRREELGRTEKLRILVDKVMQPEDGWVTKQWMVRETAEAGFNVYSPRHGHERLDEVRQVTRWCEQYGMFHIPWMRGTHGAPSGAAADGKRVLWADGTEQPIWSVCSDEFWEWTTKYIVEYAKISAKTDHLIGVFLDYENYWPGGQGNLYRITYEDAILQPFLEAKDVDAPDLEPDTRKSWLQQQGLHEAFVDFQVDHWRQRCRKLREDVDKHDPKFQFCIYPAPGTPFMVRACYPEWSTSQAPLILADASVYGRPSRFLPQTEALEVNRKRLLDRMQVPREAGIPFIYSGGIDPVVRGADPEFCGKNAVMISDVTAGYWVFYEGVEYEKRHPDYFKWFAWANNHIKVDRLDAWREPRETLAEWALDVFDRDSGGFELVAPSVKVERMELPRATLRRDNMLLVAAEEGQSVEIELRNVPVGRYKSILVWDLRSAEFEKIASGTIPYDEQGTVRFTPGADGVYLLGASAGSCGYSVVAANAPIGFLTVDGTSFIHGVRRMYFHVPEHVAEFSITASGHQRETVRVNVFQPDGTRCATGQTSPRETTARIDVQAGAGAGGTWSLETVSADKGVLEDYSIELSSNLPPVLSLAPAHVFRNKREK